MFNRLNGYFEGINGNKYLMLVPTNESKEKRKKFEELWIKIRDLIRSVTKKSNDCNEKYMKIKYNSGDELPLNKTIKIRVMVKLLLERATFHENNKYYPQVFLDECLYEFELYKCYIMIELTFLKELMLIKQVHQKGVIFIAIVIS